MPADIDFLNFGSQPITFFSDTMATGPAPARNIFGPPSDAWIYLLLGGDSPYAGPFFPSFSFGNALIGGGNGCAVGGISIAGVSYGFAGGICPRVMYVASAFYNASQKFVQYKFNRATNTNCSIGIGICNFLDNSGTGVAGNGAICHDCYLVDQGGGAAGAPGLIRWNSGATRTILNAGTGKCSQGDVIRVSFDFTVSAQVTITVTQNGTVAYTFVDNNANRMTQFGFPIYACYSMNASADGLASDFSCGVGL